MLLALLIFIANAGLTFIGGKWQIAINQGRWAAISWSVLFDFFVALDAIGIVTQKWLMLIPICLGGALGTTILLLQERTNGGTTHRIDSRALVDRH